MCGRPGPVLVERVELRAHDDAVGPSPRPKEHLAEIRRVRALLEESIISVGILVPITGIRGWRRSGSDQSKPSPRGKDGAASTDKGRRFDRDISKMTGRVTDRPRNLSSAARSASTDASSSRWSSPLTSSGSSSRILAA